MNFCDIKLDIKCNSISLNRITNHLLPFLNYSTFFCLPPNIFLADMCIEKTNSYEKCNDSYTPTGVTHVVRIIQSSIMQWNVHMLHVALLHELFFLVYKHFETIATERRKTFVKMQFASQKCNTRSK